LVMPVLSRAGLNRLTLSSAKALLVMPGCCGAVEGRFGRADSSPFYGQQILGRRDGVRSA